MNCLTLRQSLGQMAATRRTGTLMSASGQYLSAEMETLRAGAVYHWDGLRRRAEADSPYVIIQYTLAGWGAYAENGTEQRVMPGDVFVGYVPSAHVYRLPPESPGWTFFWVMFNHPYAVACLEQMKASAGAVTSLAADGLVVARLTRLFEGVWQGGFRDQWAQEQALFEFVWEYVRHEHNRRYATPLREQMLDDVRGAVMAALDSPPDVARLARTHGMSRSHFSHEFRRATGLPPAQFAIQVRLEEVTRLLLETDQPLRVIATATGFADANHLCKVFRRHYHISPGTFRHRDFAVPLSRPAVMPFSAPEGHGPANGE